jgi:prepilin-type N-terminal cleavage/methylation domain-containing protein
VQGARHESGFTLVELSIVIVIIGLIVAGVVGGQSLVKTSKMNAQIIDFNKFEVAYNAFKLEYNAVPGDMRNASSYWVGSTNGDGNGRITQHANWANDLNTENLKFFEHLSRAKLVPETYTNVFTLNVGYPALKLNSRKGMIVAGYIEGPDPNTADGYQISGAESDSRSIAALHLEVATPVVLGVPYYVSEYNDANGVASPLTISAIDKKIDDGFARTGKFQGYRAFASTTGDCLTGISGNYLLTETRDICFAKFIIAK